jgi:hypothetical protein
MINLERGNTLSKENLPLNGGKLKKGFGNKFRISNDKLRKGKH